MTPHNATWAAHFEAMSATIKAKRDLLPSETERRVFSTISEEISAVVSKCGRFASGSFIAEILELAAVQLRAAEELKTRIGEGGAATLADYITSALEPEESEDSGEVVN